MELNKIICGDTIEEMKKLPNECVDLIFSDPPYWMRVSGTLNRVEGTEFDGCDDDWDNQFETNEDYKEFTKKWVTECKRILKPNGSFWVIGGTQCIYAIGAILQDLGFWFINDVIWYKKNPTPNFMGTRLNNSHETLIWCVKSPKSKFTFNYKTGKELNTDNVTEEEYIKGVRKQMGSVWKIGICQGDERIKKEDGSKLHSTQKPEELLRRIIAISSKVGDTVFDPFGGTMTTSVVAKRMGRKYLTIEREKEYCEYGEKRLANTNEEIGDIEKSVFDIKPLRVKLPDMIKDGYFKVGEHLYLKDGTDGGELREDGRVLYNGKDYDIHTLCPIIKGIDVPRQNGFDFWYVKRDGELKSIDDIRNEYRDFVSKQGN